MRPPAVGPRGPRRGIPAAVDDGEAGEFAVLRQFDSAIEAELARTALEAAGLYAAVWDEDSQLGPVARGVRLVVRTPTSPQASDILAQAADRPSLATAA